jgi:hypothetical protein
MFHDNILSTGSFKKLAEYKVGLDTALLLKRFGRCNESKKKKQICLKTIWTIRDEISRKISRSVEIFSIGSSVTFPRPHAGEGGMMKRCLFGSERM